MFIVLSQMTTGPSYERVYAHLRASIRVWDDIADMPVSRLRRLVRGTGLRQMRTRRIRSIVLQLHRDFGIATLSALRQMSDREAEAYLTSLPGEGEKTAKCVLMYSLGRRVLPVDTHVRRVMLRVGLLSPEVRPSGLHAAADAAVPPSVRYSLHVGGVVLGRAVCRAVAPRCGECCLNAVCEHAARLVPDAVSPLPRPGPPSGRARVRRRAPR